MNLPAGWIVTLWKQALCSQQGSDQPLHAGAVLQTSLCTPLQVLLWGQRKRIWVQKRNVHTAPRFLPKAFSHDWDVNDQCMDMLTIRTCRESGASLQLIAKNKGSDKWPTAQSRWTFFPHLCPFRRSLEGHLDRKPAGFAPLPWVCCLIAHVLTLDPQLACLKETNYHIQNWKPQYSAACSSEHSLHTAPSPTFN